jgi:pimeloyl-ACP methyl ester carboxylesterase
VALGAAALARNLRRLVLYEPAPGVSQVASELLTRLDALLAEGEREELLSLFLTEVGFDAAALEQLRASPVWAGRVAAAHTIAREVRAEASYQPDAKALVSLSIPVLLLLGSESPEWAKRGTELVQSLLPNSRLSLLEGEGHIAILTAPQLVADQVTRFLDE